MRRAEGWRVRRGRLATLSAALLCLQAAATGAAPGAAASPAAAPAHASVIGGTPASIADFPWLAYVEATDAEDLEFSCTGTVVAPRIVLTAGHCVEDTEITTLDPASTYSVTTGIASVGRAGPEDVSAVSEVLIYPHFDPLNVHGDAGLLILASPVAAPPLPLAGAADGASYAPRTPISIAGWGVTGPNAVRSPSRLQVASMVVKRPRYCKRHTRNYYLPYSTSRQLCAVHAPGRAVSGCYGDSGGPAIARRGDGSALQVGIVSTGGPECSTSQPNVFARVDLVSVWVSRWIAAVEEGAPAPTVRIPRPRPPDLSFGRAMGRGDSPAPATHRPAA